MDSTAPKATDVRSNIESSSQSLAAVNEALFLGAEVQPVEMLRVLRAARLLKAELETLEQALSSMGQKK